MRTSSVVHVIGAGLSGCEAAWQLGNRGIPVILHDMKPGSMTPAHRYAGYAELVCSNSLKSNAPHSAAGILKEELRRLGSLVMAAADRTKVPAGSALAVDRKAFSDAVTEAVKSHGNITTLEGEVKKLPRDGIVIVATGPLTAGALAEEIADLTGSSNLYFFDAAAPIVAAGSIDYSRAFFASRYGRGSDYLNCPMNKDEYARFHEALVSAECAELKDFEKGSVFEGCMPVEVMARRGYDTLRFGPLRPVGITDSHTGEHPFAVVQLRREDAAGTMYNMVGFQTHLKFSEQKRVFSLIPGLEKLEILRYGVMHRNTYIRSPKALDAYGRLKSDEKVYFAGQITGVEGYMESTAGGLLAGIFAASDVLGLEKPEFSAKTALGALLKYITEARTVDFQPMNIHFGIMEPPERKIRDKAQKGLYMASRAFKEIEEAKKQFRILEANHV